MYALPERGCAGQCPTYITEFIIDSGFFYENVFTEHQNCAGFLIIKPNGDFYKQYGEDYYSEVKAFFEKK